MMEPHDCNFSDSLQACINDRCPLHRAMRAFANCLRDAAFGCAAFERGYAHRSARMWSDFRRDYVYRDDSWFPGCQRAAPGWGEL